MREAGGTEDWATLPMRSEPAAAAIGARRGISTCRSRLPLEAVRGRNSVADRLDARVEPASWRLGAPSPSIRMRTIAHAATVRAGISSARASVLVLQRYPTDDPDRQQWVAAGLWDSGGRIRGLGI